MSAADVEIRGVRIEDTFAEAFGMRGVRIVITAKTLRWAREAASKLTGFATSVIACKCEAAVERELTPDETPDARPGVSVLLFTMDADSLGKRLVERVGQTVLTCPTTSCFDGLPEAVTRVPSARALRVFGDRFQISKVLGGERYWRIPVMEGEFLVQESFGVQKGVGGGNFLILAEDADRALDAAESAVDAIAGMSGVILPFPGGVVRSGSKVGARAYAGMIASTNDAYCPTIRPITRSSLPGGVNAVLELVLDGLDYGAVARAMRAGIDAACRPGVVAISAGNYGGRLGPHHFHLHRILSGDDTPVPRPAAPATGQPVTSDATDGGR
ncbi:MAG TPA: formylmethanofuran--tetrahydromethanopterin N-formyltransferase [Gemmatirosa sp.]